MINFMIHGKKELKLLIICPYRKKTNKEIGAHDSYISSDISDFLKLMALLFGYKISYFLMNIHEIY